MLSLTSQKENLFSEEKDEMFICGFDYTAGREQWEVSSRKVTDHKEQLSCCTVTTAGESFSSTLPCETFGYS